MKKSTAWNAANFDDLQLVHFASQCLLAASLMGCLRPSTFVDSRFSHACQYIAWVSCSTCKDFALAPFQIDLELSWNGQWILSHILSIRFWPSSFHSRDHQVNKKQDACLEFLKCQDWVLLNFLHTSWYSRALSTLINLQFQQPNQGFCVLLLSLSLFDLDNFWLSLHQSCSPYLQQHLYWVILSC